MSESKGPKVKVVPVVRRKAIEVLFDPPKLLSLSEIRRRHEVIPEVENQQTEFDVVLISFGSSKLKVIKEVRALTGIPLREAKEEVESVPFVLREAVSKEEADEIKRRIVTAGGRVEIV